MENYMLEPAVGGGTVPVLDTDRDGDDIARVKELCGLAPLLIEAFAGDAYKNLLDIVVDVPVVAASGFESDIAEGRFILLQSSQIGLPNKVLLIELVRESFGKWKIFSGCDDGVGSVFFSGCDDGVGSVVFLVSDGCMGRKVFTGC